MKKTVYSIVFALLLPLLVLFGAAPPGIPEPPLILYGTIATATGRVLLTSGGVDWFVAGGASTTSVFSKIANVNGQFFYVARIPFETRFAGNFSFEASPNILPLTASPVTFTRSARVNGIAATLVPSASTNFTFSKADRGAIHRVDLLVDLPPTESDIDTDADGVPDWAEAIAGTDPKDPQSVFKATTNLHPAPSGGFVLEWSSVAGKKYRVLRTSDLSKPFVDLSNAITAAGATQSFTDTSATGLGPFFYRIRLDE